MNCSGTSDGRSRYELSSRSAAEAKHDLKQAVEYIAEHAPLAAQRWLKGFLAAVKSLKTNPEQWPLAKESESLGIVLREWYFRTKSSATRAVFIIVDKEVRVLRVRRPGQDLLRETDLP